MKNYFMLFLISFLYLIPSMAQTDNTYDDLLELYVDEKYEKLAYKAEDYFLNDKYKKDPLPYLYYSMAHFAFIKDESLLEKYPKAFKESMKYAGKFVKKDKQAAYIDEAEDYFAELRALAMEEAENQIINLKYTKAKGTYKYLCNLDTKDPGAKVFMSYSCFMMKSVREAQTFLEESLVLLDEVNISSLTKEQKSLLKNSVITMTEWEENGPYRNQITSLLEKTKDALKVKKTFKGLMILLCKKIFT